MLRQMNTSGLILQADELERIIANGGKQNMIKAPLRLINLKLIGLT